MLPGVLACGGDGGTGPSAGDAPEIVLAAMAGVHTCATLDGVPYCWGANGVGQLGGHSEDHSPIPVAVGTTIRFAELKQGKWRTIGRDERDGTYYSWGLTRVDGAIAHNPTPLPDSLLTTWAFRQVVEAYDFECGLTLVGTAHCWGINSLGQLGDGTTNYRGDPDAPVGGGQRFTSLATSTHGQHMCGIAPGGPALCWGANWAGQLGDGTVDSSGTPVVVAGHLTFAELATGVGFTCGRTVDQRAYCWGDLGPNHYGSRPVLVSEGLTIKRVIAGGYVACLLFTTGEARCWGQGGSGQVGDGTGAIRSAPTLVTGGLRFTALEMGFYHACGVTTDREVYCWGDNRYGQAGDGTRFDIRPWPVRVQFPELP